MDVPTRTHTYTHAHTHTCTHTRTHAQTHKHTHNMYTHTFQASGCRHVSAAHTCFPTLNVDTE